MTAGGFDSQGHGRPLAAFPSRPAPSLSAVSTRTLGFEALAGVTHQAPINGAAVRDPIGHPKCAKPPTKLGEG
jgi:hypothetical protein